MKNWKTTTFALGATLLSGHAARADFKVWLPDVNMGELALEIGGRCRV